jgi:low temperature requirement protein LtrA
MTSAPARSKLFRARNAHGHHRVTYVELCFDLVFVFAITQLSHDLLGNLTPMGGVELGLLLAAVWWVWIYTSWTRTGSTRTSHRYASCCCA